MPLMTVDEMVIELEIIQSQGHGSAKVFVDDHTFGLGNAHVALYEEFREDGTEEFMFNLASKEWDLNGDCAIVVL